MSIKLLPLSIAILASLISIKSVNANPSSCKASATTTSERKSVKILENMYDLQAQMNVINEDLDKLNNKRSLGYDSFDANSVDNYNKLINDYNNTVNKKNSLSDKYNVLKQSFNTLVYKSPFSSNTSFVNCLNMAVLRMNTSTTSLNISSTSLSIKSMNVETRNMMRNLNN